jgi:hypothetical protein
LHIFPENDAACIAPAPEKFLAKGVHFGYDFRDGCIKG